MHNRTPTTHAVFRRERTPERGAALLLSSYLVSFTLLVLTTALFVRSANEMRLAERSAELAQSFWGAEGAMDAAMSDLRTQPAPALSRANPCTSVDVPRFGPPVVESTYSLCLEREDAVTGTKRYSITANGTTAGTTERLYSLVDYGSETIQFEHVLYGARTELANFETGSMDTRRSRLIANTTFQGDIASRLSENLFWTSPRTGETVELCTICVSQRSAIQGDLLVGPEGDPDRQILVRDSLHLGRKGPLDELKELPPVVVPPNAQSLGERLILQDGERKCLEPGTYVVGDLRLLDLGRGAPELCTTGPVDLYVTENLVVGGGQLYGQPVSSDPFARQYSSADLRIFYAKGPELKDGKLRWPWVNLFRMYQDGQDPGLVAAAIYAPQAMAMMWNGTFLGGLISGGNQAVFGWSFLSANPPAGKAYFDTALRERKFAVGPPTVTTVLWTRQPQETPAPAPAPTPPPITTTGWGTNWGTGTVICTELHRQGFLPDAWYQADMAYAQAHIEPETLALYQSWASHVTALMRRSPLVTRAVKPLGLAWAQHMAYEMGAAPEDNLLGRTLHSVGLPVHQLAAKLRATHRPVEAR